MTKAPAWKNRIVGQGTEDPTQLLANPRNWRRHPGVQRDALRDSLDEVGWVQQILVNTTTNHLIDGHARVEEAISRGEAEVPVLYVTLTEDEERLVLATLDPLGALATVDVEALTSLRAELGTDSVALKRMLDDILAAHPLPKVFRTDPDDVPEPPEEPYVKPGDLYVLGDHRLLCGDATKAEDVARLLDGAKADMVFTDPPYGVDIERQLQNDNLAPPEMMAFLRSAFAALLASCAPGSAWYVCAPHSPIGLAFGVPLSEIGVWRSSLVWVKNCLVMGRADYHYRHEVIYYGWAPGAAHHAVADRTQDTVWEFPRPSASPEHPTMKPVALVERALRNSTSPKQAVLDTFSGSGTTIIAAETLGRRCYAMEIDPKYVQVAIERWQNFTGKEAQQVGG
jgi:DNA modification methylase